MISIYIYKNCSTCKKAIQWLNNQNIEYKAFPIRDTPPSLSELEIMLSQYKDIKRLFNTSGMDYRQLKLKDKIANMSDKECLTLLNSNGNLIKRPFLITKNKSLVGFNLKEWEDNLSHIDS